MKPNASSLIDEEIRREERLIELYQAELASITTTDAASEQQPRVASIKEVLSAPTSSTDLQEEEEEEDDTTDDWWWSLFPQNRRHRSLNLLDPADPAILALQSTLLGFEFTDIAPLVSSKSATTDDDDKDSITQFSYEFRGRFVKDRNLEATLRIDFAKRKGDDKEATSLTNPKEAGCSARILRVDWNLSRPWLLEELERAFSFPIENENGDDQTSTENTNKDVALWMHRIVSYLEFDQQRRDFLRQYSRWIAVDDDDDDDDSSPSRKVQGSSSTTALHIRLSNNDNNNASAKDQDSSQARTTEAAFLSLAWGWCWKTGRDSLRLLVPQDDADPPTTQPTRGSVLSVDLAPGDYLSSNNNGLEELVEAVGSCQEAILMILGDDARRLVHQSSSSSKKKKSKSAARRKSAGQDDDYGKEHNPIYEPDGSSKKAEEGRKKSPGGNDKLSEYELQRLERIKRNEEHLSMLGLGPSTSGSSTLASLSDTPHRKRKHA